MFENVWKWLYEYFFTFEGLATFVIIIIFIYFVCTTKRKKYNFQIPFTYDIEKIKKSKKKKKKKINKHEEECRRIFQKLFSCKFKSIRPDWLKNPATGKNLEIDGYNSRIITPIGKGLGFEYDGIGHSQYTPHFHKNGPDDFEYQVAKDSWKDKLCKERNVLLIRIPHFVHFDDLERYIKMMLSRRNVQIKSYSIEPDHVIKL